MSWFGADPGGRRANKPCFGVAWLVEDGTFIVDSVDCARAAFNWINERSAKTQSIGIDCPLWWSAGRSGERQVDVLLRKRYRDRIGSSIMSINSLPGAALVQGVMLAHLARIRDPTVQITETHPKALLKAMRIVASKTAGDWSLIAKTFGLKGPAPDTSDKLDALLSAAAARNGITGLWVNDLAKLKRGADELDPNKLFFGSVQYHWFEDITQ